MRKPTAKNATPPIWALIASAIATFAFCHPVAGQPTPATARGTIQLKAVAESGMPTLLDRQPALTWGAGGTAGQYTKFWVGTNGQGNLLLFDLSRTYVNSLNGLTGAVSFVTTSPGLTLTSTGSTISLGLSAASGDVSGTYPALSVVALRGIALSATAPTPGQFLQYNSGSGIWAPFTITPTSIGAAAAAHTHSGSDITSGTVPAARLPAASTSAPGIVQIAAAGGTTAGTVIDASDARNSNARTPTAHTHAASDITSGIIAPARLGTGTASATTFLTGASTYATALTGVAFTTPGTVYTPTVTLTGNTASIALALNNQSPATFFAGPVGMPNGPPTFRALVPSDIPFTGGLIYSQITIKTAPIASNVAGTSTNGDTINASTTRQYFASQCPIPANFLTAGMRLHLYGSGLYSTSGTAGVGALAPAVTPIVSLFNTSTNAPVDLVTSAPLQNPAGASNLGFSFDVTMTVRSIGTSGKITADGTLRFQAASGAALITVVPTTTSTVNTTTLNYLVLSATSANNTAGNTFTDTGEEVTAEPAVAASN